MFGVEESLVVIFQERSPSPVYGARLESAYTERYREFKSLPLRHYFLMKIVVDVGVSGSDAATLVSQWVRKIKRRPT